MRRGDDCGGEASAVGLSAAPPKPRGGDPARRNHPCPTARAPPHSPPVAPVFADLFEQTLLAARALFSDLHPAWPLAIVLPAIAALPLPGRPRNGGVIGYLAFAVASVAATHAVFFGEDRYHMVLTPALCVLAACALQRSRPEERNFTSVAPSGFGMRIRVASSTSTAPCMVP